MWIFPAGVLGALPCAAPERTRSSLTSNAMMHGAPPYETATHMHDLTVGSLRDLARGMGIAPDDGTDRGCRYIEPAHAVLPARVLASASRLASTRLIAVARASPAVSEIHRDPNCIVIGVGWLVLPRWNAPIHRIVYGGLARCCRFSHAGAGAPHGRAPAIRIELVT